MDWLDFAFMLSCLGWVLTPLAYHHGMRMGRQMTETHFALFLSGVNRNKTFCFGDYEVDFTVTSYRKKGEDRGDPGRNPQEGSGL